MCSGRWMLRASRSSKKACSNLAVYSAMGTCGVAGVADDLVVYVGDVHDVVDGDSLLADEAAEDVDVEEGAEVADVAVVVDGGAAAVHAERGCCRRGRAFQSFR